MKNKKKKQHNFKEDLPLHKFNDLCRRQFISNVGIFLAAFGVPQIVRNETMEKISKKIFGSATAWAQQSGITPAIIISGRSGIPLAYAFGRNNEFGNQQNFNDYNQAYTPNQGTAVDVTGSPDIPFVLGPGSVNQLSRHADRCAFISCGSGNHGHQSDFETNGMTGPSGSASFPVALAAQNKMLDGSIAYGGPMEIGDDGDDVDISKTGPYGAAAAPQIFSNSLEGFRDSFSSFSFAGGGLDESASRNILGVLSTGWASVMERILKSNSDNVDAANSVNTSSAELLSLDLKAALTPSNQLLEDCGANLNEPNKWDAKVNLGEAVAQSLLAITTKAASVVVIKIGGGDWHNQTGTADNPNNTWTQWGAYVAEITSRLLDQANNGNFTLDGANVGDKLRFVINSEFLRKIRGCLSDNGDGGTTGCFLAADPSIIRGGSYARATSDGRDIMGWDDSSRQFINQRTNSQVVVDTIAKFLTVDLKNAGHEPAGQTFDSIVKV